jgi:hypothetical protein
MTEDPEGTSHSPAFLSSSSQPSSEPFAGSSLLSSASEVCRLCNNRVLGDYFRVNGLMACQECASQARSGQPQDSHAAFTRGLLLGIGAAVIGLAVYAGFTILTGWYIGYLALGVGWLVAKAIKRGSNGLGGRRYQVAAVLLTYAAISLAAVPIGISYAFKHNAQQQKQAQPSSADSTTVPGGEASAAKPVIHLRSVAGQLLWLGFTSPFMGLQDGVSGVIGLFILFIGLRMAWKMTAGAPLQVDGPFQPLAPATP